MKKRKRARLGQSTNSQDRLSDTRSNHVWALDFQSDQASDCRVLKYLNITDEFSKEEFATEVVSSMRGNDITTIPKKLNNVHGAPDFVRMDNGIEMTSNTVSDWCRFSTSEISSIEPRSLWPNSYMESFNGHLRNEFLGIEEFTTLLEAKIMAEDYNQDQNRLHPHSSLGYLTSNEIKRNLHHDKTKVTTVPGH